LKPTTICNIELDIPTLLTKPQNTQKHIKLTDLNKVTKLRPLVKKTLFGRAIKNEVIAHSVTEI